MSDLSRDSSIEILTECGDSCHKSDLDDQPSDVAVMDAITVNQNMPDNIDQNSDKSIRIEIASEGYYDTCEQSEQDDQPDVPALKDKKNVNENFSKCNSLENRSSYTPNEMDFLDGQKFELKKPPARLCRQPNPPNFRHSLARLCKPPNPSIPSAFSHNQSSGSVYLNIPCPKCQKADCFWQCENCSVRLQYKEGIVFCECSQGILQNFEFCCINNSHGAEFYRYENNAVKPVLERLTLTKSVYILLLGSTGVGKSILINSILSYLKHETLKQAETRPLPILVPTFFQVENDFYEETDVKVGEENENESFAIGESATRCPKLYFIVYNNVVFNFIDTPGLCDTAGINKDKENLNQIINFICSFSELHGICIMLKSGESKMSVEMKYCIKQLLLHFHKTSIKNFMFCFTYSRTIVAQSSPSTVRELLKEINKENGTDMALNKEIAFSLDNEAFRYLCARANGESYGNQDNYCQDAWERSRNETFRLLQHVLSNSPHLTDETVVLNTARSIIIGLNKPLATITTQIQKNKQLLDAQRIDIENLTGKEKDFQSRIRIYQIYTKKRKLDSWRVVCNKCAQVKQDCDQKDYKVFPNTCCENCRAPILYFCRELNFLGKCRQCNCPKSFHEHINYEYVENKKYIEDEKVKIELSTVTSKIEAKKRVIKWIGTLIEEYDNEQKIVNKCAAIFSNYLKSNSIILNNRSHEEYLNMELENAKISGKSEDIKNLKDALESYFEEKEILEKQLSQSDTDPASKELTAEDIFKARNQLFDLKLSGSTLDSIFDTDLTNPAFHPVSSIQQQITKNQCKKEKPGWKKRTQQICGTIIAKAIDIYIAADSSYREPRYDESVDIPLCRHLR